MLYMISGNDVKNSQLLRNKVRKAHLSRLQKLKKQGRLILAGSHPRVDSAYCNEAGCSGSLIVAAFNSLAEASDWANQDPYVQEGVYRDMIVKPFNKVLP